MPASASSTSVPSPPGLHLSSIRSDVVIAFRPHGHVHVCGVFHARDTTTRLPTRHMWLEDVRLWPATVRKYTAAGYNNFQFTEYSSPDRWEIHHGPEYPLQTGLSSDALLDFASPTAGAGASSEVTQHSANTGERPAEEFKHEDPEAVAEMEAARRRMEEDRTRRLEQELAALRAETERLRRAAAAAPAGAPADTAPAPPAANADNEAAQFLQFMRENQALMAQQNQALIDALTRSQNQQNAAPALAPAPLTRPQIEFPSWDGSEATKADFLFRIGTMKNDAFFQAVTDWTKASPGLSAQNNYLQANIVDKIPLKHRTIFADDPLLAQDGFAMLDRLLVTLRGDTVENRLLAITELAAFEYTATDTTATYMARLRGLQAALKGCTIDQFITLIALARMDPGLYPGITNLFLQGDTTLLNEDLSQVERRMERQDRIRSITGESADSARRSKPKGKSPAAPSPNPAPASDKATYPPSTKPSFSTIVEFLKNTTNCPGCFNRGKGGEKCGKECCLPLLAAGWICKYSPDEAKKLYGDLRAKQRQQHNEKGRKVTDAEKPQPDDNAKEKQNVESAKRATSVEPPSSKKPLSYSDAAKSAGQSSQENRKNYWDELGSDSDDNEGYFLRSDDDDDKPNTSSNNYIVASANRAAVSHQFSSIARHELNTIRVAIRSEDEAACCADSGATKHMFPDYNTFVSSYHKCSNKFVQLGDSTELPIHGYGTAKFSLNGHVILVRNALHVPDLTDPLYSLRQHRFMKGCGFFSHYDSGAFLLFPDFTVKVDDRVDCLLNFKAIGRSKSPPIEYAEPRDSHPAFHAARPAHIIPSDDIDDATVMSHIQYNIPTPKSSAKSTAPPQSLPSERSPSPTTVIADLELESSALKPLSKRLLSSLHSDPQSLPPVPPCYTAGA
eukprot:scaffold28205_cov85-Cyclotella_meneghiniana.AAC.4